MKTLISFNNGASWIPLQPPRQTWDGKNYTCRQQDCKLHLHLTHTRFYDPPFAPKDCLGLVLAHGNVGKSPTSRMMSLYVSNDAGASWIQAMPGAFKVAVSNFGGLIVIAPTHKPTRSVFYSLNHGKSFEEAHVLPSEGFMRV